MNCFIKLLSLSVIFLPQKSYGTDAILLTKLIGQSAEQLRELKEIMEINNATFDQIEKANRKVQQTRYKMLRARYIVESSKTLGESNVHSTQDGLNLMRKSKSLGQEYKSFGEEFKDLSDEEKERLLEEIDKVNDEAKTLEGKITERKVLILENRVDKKRAADHNAELNKLAILAKYNEETSSGDLSPSTAQVETAKNTGLTNKILIQSAETGSEQLKQLQVLNSHLQQKDLDDLKKEEDSKKFWGKK